MTEWIERGIAEVQMWADGRGCDVKVADEPKEKYYFMGKDFPKAGAVKLMVRDGAGDRKGWYEIIDWQPIRVNPEYPKSLEAIVQPGGQVLMPLDKLREIMSLKSALKDSRIRALDLATKIYAAMDTKEKVPRRAADDVVEIAHIIEGFLV